MKLDFSGKTVVVTGAGSGIGAATAEAFRLAGAKCLRVDFAFSTAEDYEDTLKLDITDTQAVDQVSRKIGQNQPIDALANAAGVLLRGRLEDEAFQDAWDRTLDVNVTSAMRLSSGLLTQLKLGAGAIVNVCSIQSFMHLPNSIAYSVSKGALAQLTRGVATEFGPDGIRCNAVAPGAIQTKMTKNALQGPYRERVIERTPIRRIGLPSDVAGPILFLCSDAAKHITGTVLPVDGGFLVN